MFNVNPHQSPKQKLRLLYTISSTGMNGPQYVNSILANHSDSQTNWVLKPTKAAAPSPAFRSPPLTHPRKLSGHLDVSDELWSAEPWRWREVSKLPLTKVWFLVSEALKCSSVKEKLLRKNDTHWESKRLLYARVHSLVLNEAHWKPLSSSSFAMRHKPLWPTIGFQRKTRDCFAFLLIGKNFLSFWCVI